MILIIESSSPYCSVALTDTAGEILRSEKSETINAHAELLPAMVQKMINFSNSEHKKISAVAVGKGPGSYTGLRIGTSLAKGLCYAAEIPLIAADPFLGMASRAARLHIANNYFCAMDARRNEVYCGVYGRDLDTVKEVHSHILHEDTFAGYVSDTLVVAGNCNPKIKEICNYGASVIWLDMEPEASFMATEVSKRFNSGNFESTAYFEPSYLKEFQAGTPQKFRL